MSEESIFADNPDPRCPVVLLLDKSRSMSGAPISALNEGLQIFRKALLDDALAARRIEIAIISFGPITTDVDFVTADHFIPPQLKPEGDTPMGRAITIALDMLATRKQTYHRNGIPYYRPWVFLITDGGPTDSWTDAAMRVHEEEAGKKIAFFAVGTPGADFDKLAKITPRTPLHLEGLKFGDLFKWLSASLAAVSQSQPGTEVALRPPTGWASV
jgi:uncharacterized protein YegL